MKCLSTLLLQRSVLSGLAYSLLLCLILTTTSACTFPSDGWYQRMEQNLGDAREAVQKNQENTRALVKNTGNEKLISEWGKRLQKVKAPGTAPGDKTSGNWIETLLYILLGMSGLGGMAKGAGFLYKIQPKKGMN